MNRINGTVESNSDAYEYYILWEERNFDSVNNKSSVYAEVHIYCNAHSAYQNQGLVQNLWINGVTFSSNIGVNLSAGKDVILVSGQLDNIYHETDGSKNINISSGSDLPKGGGYAPKSGSASEWVWLTHFPRQANFTGYFINNIGLNYVDIAHSLDKHASSLLYSVNGGEWNHVSPISGDWSINGVTRIYNLYPNTVYNFRLKAIANGLETITDYMYATTKDIARINRVDNFNHGDNVHIAITNPANISDLSLRMLINNTHILTRTITQLDIVFELTDLELDALYKQYKNTNELIATFYLIGEGYEDSKTCNISLKGNQKTTKVKINQNIKRGKIFTKINNEWKRAVIWTKNNGIWKRGI
ncbi:MAG: hypothetical protein HFJ48_00085 [Clostridia bacterium]|nr:hypothetical protein [Clostridia bacterium]